MVDKHCMREFQHIPEDWEICRIKDLIDQKIIIDIMDGNHGALHPKSTDYVKKGVPFIVSADVKNNKVNLKSCKFLDHTWMVKLRKGFAKKGDVLLTHKGTIGSTAIVPESVDTVILSPQITYYRVNEAVGRLNNIFLKYSFDSQYFQKALRKNAVQSTRDYIGITKQKELYIILPQLSEQKRIACILSAIDEHIEEVYEMIKDLKELKKGLMQKLFTVGIGHKDYKTYRDIIIPQNWNVSNLSSIASKIIGGGTPSRKVDEYFTGNIPWATVKDLGDSNYKNDTIEHITSEAIEESSTKLIEKNQLIIATRMGLGRGFINTVPMAINQDLKAIYPKENVDVLFLMYWYLSKSKLIESLGKGSTVKGIKIDDVKELEIFLPPLEEQKQIASILSSVDERIELYEQEREDYQQLKKGLMQQLLTGKVRVKLD